MSANETILWGSWVDYSPIGGSSYGGGGTIAGSALATFESNVGKQCSLVHFNNGNWMNNGSTVAFTSTALDILTSAGRLPFIEWNPWDQAAPANDFSLRANAIANGTWDSYIISYALAAKAWGKPLLIRTMTEANLLGQYPWQFGSNVGATVTFGGNTWANALVDVVTAYQRIAVLFKVAVGATNVKFVWCPNILATTGITSVLSMAQMYPGSTYVDWIGVDGYGYEPDMSTGQVLHGTPNFAGGGGTGLQDSYAQLIALDPALPLMICETGINGCGPANPQIAISSITANGSTWTLVTSTAPATPWLATNGVTIVGATPSGYNGQFTIASVTNTTTVVITNATSPGALVTHGTAQQVDRINRAASIKQSLELDVPAMPRIKALTFFWTGYDATQWTMDWNGTQPTNIDMVAFKAAIANGHYLAGSQMGSDLSTRTWSAFQDQPMLVGDERYMAVLKSTPTLTGLWLLNDAVNTNPVVDSSGNGRTGSVIGTVTLGSANVVQAEPTWTSVSFPGVAGNNITVANNAAFSPATTQHFSIELSWYAPGTPASNMVLVSKGASANYEWEVNLTTTPHVRFIAHQLSGGTYTNYDHSVTSFPGAHHAIFTVDLGAAAPVVGYIDGGAPLSSAAPTGVMTAGTAPVMFGQLGDNTAPSLSGFLLGTVALYSSVLSLETVADHYAAWRAAPGITAGPTAS